MLWWTHQQLRVSSAKTRLAVVQKLAVNGDPDAVGPLIFSLKDKEASVRCGAFKALMCKRQDWRAVEPLIQMLRDYLRRWRAAAAETLGHLGDPLAVNHSSSGSCAGHDPIVRTIAARGLHRLG